MSDRQWDEQRHGLGLPHCVKEWDTILRTRRPLEQRNMADFLPVVKGLVEERLLTDNHGGDGRGIGQTDYIWNPLGWHSCSACTGHWALAVFHLWSRGGQPSFWLGHLALSRELSHPADTMYPQAVPIPPFQLASCLSLLLLSFTVDDLWIFPSHFLVSRSSGWEGRTYKNNSGPFPPPPAAPSEEAAGLAGIWRRILSFHCSGTLLLFFSKPQDTKAGRKKFF